MARRNVWLWILIVVVIVGGGFLLYQSTPANDEVESAIQEENEESAEIDYHAGFAIFTNGTFRVFTAAMYHNLSSDVYIEAQNPNIILVKKKGTTWGDFFDTLPLELTTNCLTTGTGESFCSGDGGELHFFLNGKRAGDLLSLEINDGDRALISFGNQSEQQIEKEFESVPTF